MAADSGERIESLIYTVTFAADTRQSSKICINSSMNYLIQLKILLFLSMNFYLLCSYSFPIFEPCSVIGEIGLRHLQFLSEIIPALSTGLHASKLDDSSESTWEWILKFKGKIYSVAFESGSDGRRLLALKFVACKEVGFNISWIRRGHPMLKLGRSLC
ncbi:Adenosylcobinamide-GDP ribazoletransferase [Bienertia sinuspersici]